MLGNIFEPANDVNDLKKDPEAEYPLEMIHVDFLVIGGKKDPRKDINVLVATDHFTCYAQAYVTMSQTTATVAKVLFERFFTQYGWPAKQLTDQSPQFKGRLFQQLMHEAQIRKIRTTPYHPEGVKGLIEPS